MILNASTILLLLNPSSMGGGGGGGGIDRYPPNSVTMMPCFWRLCQKYCTPGQHMVLGNLIIFSVSPAKSDFQQRILSTIYDVTDIRVSGMVKQWDRKHAGTEHVTDRAKYYVLFAYELEEIGAQLRQLQSLATWSPVARFLIFMLGRRDKRALKKQARPILELCQKFGVHDVMVTAESDVEKKLMVYSWLPYELDSCGRIRYIRLVDECKGIFLTPYVDATVEDKFPRDMLGCQIKVGAVTIRPFVDATANSGIEVELLKMIGKLYNFTANITMSKQSRTQIGIHNNGTLSPFYLDLKPENLRSDILIGGLFESSRTRRHFGACVSYMRDDVTWVVRTSAGDRMWRNVFAVYSSIVWMSTVALLVFISAVLYVIYRIQHGFVVLARLWTLVFNAILGLPASYTLNTQSFSVRVVFAALLIFGLHFTTGYNSALISSLTNPGEATHLSTSGQLYKSDLVMKGGLTELWRVSEISARKSEQFEICEDTEKCIREMAAAKTEQALAVSRLHARDVLRRNAAAGKSLPLYVFSEEENLYEYNVVMLVRKNYHLLSMLNLAIRNLTENGMIMKLAQDNGVLSAGTTAVEDMLDVHQSGSEVKLSMVHLAGAFFVLIAGLTFSAVVCCLEIFYNNCQKIQIVVHKKANN